MSSRMERYYEKHPEDFKRTSKNSKLYDEVYKNRDYDNIERLDYNVGKQIDISDVKAMLEKRELYNDVKDYRIVKPEVEVTRKVKYYDEAEPSSHDIKEMIDAARGDKPVEESRRSLDDTQVLTLKDLVSRKTYAEKTEMDKEDVKDLINTIYDTNLLKSENGDGLLDDMRATGETVVSPSIKQILDDAKKATEVEDMDNSFFTSSLGFKPEDLKNDDDALEEVKDSNNKTTILLIILSLLFVAVVIFIVYKFVL